MSRPLTVMIIVGPMIVEWGVVVFCFVYVFEHSVGFEERQDYSDQI